MMRFHLFLRARDSFCQLSSLIVAPATCPWLGRARSRGEGLWGTPKGTLDVTPRATCHPGDGGGTLVYGHGPGGCGAFMPGKGPEGSQNGWDGQRPAHTPLAIPPEPLSSPCFPFRNPTPRRGLFVLFLHSATGRKRLVKELICLIYWY